MVQPALHHLHWVLHLREQHQAEQASEESQRSTSCQTNLVGVRWVWAIRCSMPSTTVEALAKAETEGEMSQSMGLL